jgi:hypothetical protein
LSFTLVMALRSALALSIALGVPASAGQDAAALTASTHQSGPPSTLAKPVAEALAPQGVRVLVSKGPVALDFWWVAALPLKAGTAAPSWSDVEEGSLVGAVSIPSDFRDIRGRVIKAGVYTLRYGIQPANGDHLGVSPYREFLLLSPASVDTDAQPRGHDGTVDVSKLSVGGSHPGVWSLDPPVAAQAALEAHKTELGHDAVIMEVPVARDGKPAGALRFGLVLIGKIDA